MLSLVQKENEDETEIEIQTETVETSVPSPPDWMSFEAKLEWMRSAPDLYKKGRLVGGMISLLENYCIAIGLVRECENMIAEDGKIICGKPHPAFKMMLDAMSQAKSYASELRFGRENLSEEDRLKESNWEKGLLA